MARLYRDRPPSHAGRRSIRIGAHMRGSLLVLAILTAGLAGCTRSDVEDTRSKMKKTGQEINRELKDADRKIQEGLKNANRESKEALDEARQKTKQAGRDLKRELDGAKKKARDSTESK